MRPRKKLAVLCLVFSIVLLLVAAARLTTSASSRVPWEYRSRSWLAVAWSTLGLRWGAQHYQPDIVTIGRLRRIAKAQREFASRAYVDEDQDGVGEFGSFAELCAVPGSSARHTVPPLAVLPSGYSRVNPTGGVERAEGFTFVMLLPSTNGSPIRESPGGGFPDGMISPDYSERAWLCVALNLRRTGNSGWSYIVTQDGIVYGTNRELSPESAARLCQRTCRFMPVGNDWVQVP